jgi:hypothetical protein
MCDALRLAPLPPLDTTRQGFRAAHPGFGRGKSSLSRPYLLTDTTPRRDGFGGAARRGRARKVSGAYFFCFLTLTFSVLEVWPLQVAVSGTWARYSKVFLTFSLVEKLPWASD